MRSTVLTSRTMEDRRPLAHDGRMCARLARLFVLCASVVLLAGCDLSKITGPGSALDRIDGPPAAPRAPSVEILPEGPITLGIGDKAQLKVSAQDFTGDPTVVFSSSSPQVASVSPEGVVTALSPGSTIVSAEVLGVADSVEVMVTEADQLIQLSKTSLSFEHAVGESPCPQHVGSFAVTNLSGEVVEIELASSHPAIAVTPRRASIPPGEGLRIDVDFNCSTTASFDTQITVTGRASDGTSATKNLQVTGAITQ